MQGLADGYFVLPNTIRDYLASGPYPKVAADAPEVIEAQASVKERIQHFLGCNGTRSVDSFHRELGHIMWEYCGMERTAEGLTTAIDKIRALRKEFYANVRVLGGNEQVNQSLEKAGRVADLIELGELSQTEDGEALRHDDQFAYVAAWEWGGPDAPPILHKEDLVYDFIELKQRSYK
jgi:succinate dehydrogenase / fumarate reductase, flavoprotein subunit